jgi:Holliday junction resolvasome RuvABC endonuclease subunit
VNANEVQAQMIVPANALNTKDGKTVRNIVTVAGIDPAMANTGIARMKMDLETFQLSLDEIILISTDKRADKKKQIRQNSDDLRRGRELFSLLHKAVAGCSVCFAEVPSGAQHARSAFGFGMAVMALASIPVPLIEIQPEETKIASVGSRTAGKPEIIAWAAQRYPHAPWLRYQKEVLKKGKILRKVGDLHDDNEHTADACAVAHAGIASRQFQDLVSMLRLTTSVVPLAGT